MNRPSPKELYGKLRDARGAVQAKRVILLNQDAIADDTIELGYDIGNELPEVLAELLEVASMPNYAGSRPPHRSYEQEIKDLELFPFVVDSRRFGCRAYFKFALCEGSL